MEHETMSEEYKKELAFNVKMLREWAESVSIVFNEFHETEDWDRELDHIREETEEDLHIDVLESYTVILFFIDHVNKTLYLISVEPNGEMSSMHRCKLKF